MQKTFSSITLWKQLSEDSENGKHPVPLNILEMLKTIMDEPDDEELNDILYYAKDRENDLRFNKKLEKWLEKNGFVPDSATFQHIKLYLIVDSFFKYINLLEESYSFLTDKQKSEMELFNFLQARFTAQQKILPSSVMGNLFGMKNDRKNGLRLYRQYAFGRALMNRMPWLRITEDGKPAGPDVMLFSGSSWAEGCLEYHVNVPVKYLLESEEWKRKKLAETDIIDLNTGICVSGSNQKERAEHLKQVIPKSMDAIEGELLYDGKILMIVNSYNEAYVAFSHLNNIMSDKKGITACMVRPEDENKIPEEYRIFRGEIASYNKHTTRILIAPAQAIERGYNIVDENGHSTFGSVFFLVRPMTIPDEISSRCAKLNGIIEQRFCNETFSGEFVKSKEIRHYAVKQWNIMEEQSGKSLKYLDDTMKNDVTAGMFVLILQIFGRLARITDSKKPAPRIYFADGAFRANPEHPDGYDCLNALRNYLQKMMQNEESGEIAKTLYQPFYEAFMKGVNENVCTYISYSDDTENEYYF